jgi:hypothetical protein
MHDALERTVAPQTKPHPPVVERRAVALGRGLEVPSLPGAHVVEPITDRRHCRGEDAQPGAAPQDLLRHLVSGLDVGDGERPGARVREVDRPRSGESETVEDRVAARAGRRPGDTGPQGTEGVRPHAVDVPLNAGERIPLELNTPRLRDVAVGHPVVLVEETHVQKRAPSLGFSVRQNARGRHDDQGGGRLRGAQRGHRPAKRGGDRRHGRDVQVPFVAKRRRVARQVVSVGRFEIAKEIDLVGDDDPAVGPPQRSGGVDEGRRPGFEIIPAIPECAENTIGPALPEQRVLRHVPDDPRGIARFCIPAEALVVPHHRLPLEQHRGTIEAGVVIDLPGPVDERIERDVRGTRAHAAPRVARPGAGPQRRQAQGQRLILHVHDEVEVEPETPLEAARVVHIAQDRLGRHRPGQEHQGLKRHRDVARPDMFDEPLEVRSRAVGLVLVEPEAAVDVVAAAPVRWPVRRLFDLVLVVVERLDERAAVVRVVARPEVVRVIVVGDVVAFTLLREGPGGQRPQRDETQARANAAHVTPPPHRPPLRRRTGPKRHAMRYPPSTGRQAPVV